MWSHVETQVVVTFSRVPSTVEFAEPVEKPVLQPSGRPVVNGPLLAAVKPPAVEIAEELELLTGYGGKYMVEELPVP